MQCMPKACHDSILPTASIFGYKPQVWGPGMRVEFNRAPSGHSAVLWGCAGMERLELQKCRLERDEAGPTFTACLGRMHRLVDLCMQGSTIYAILSLGMQLERLSLAAMDLTNLPGMSALCRLQHLSIACNQLRKVPEGLQHLTCLSYLDM